MLLERKYYLDAQSMFDRACALDPQNTAYAKAQARIKSFAFGFGKKGAVSGDAGNAMTEFCCECCGEGCCEGCCEVGCESCCENCDCDCG